MAALAASAPESDPPQLLSGPVLGYLAEAGFFFGPLLVTFAAMESVEGSEVWSLSLHRFVPLSMAVAGCFFSGFSGHMGGFLPLASEVIGGELRGWGVSTSTI